MVVEVEKMRTAGAGVVLRRLLRDRLEARCLGANRAQRHQHHVAIVQSGGFQRREHRRQIALDIGTRCVGKHPSDHVDGDPVDHRHRRPGRVGFVHAEQSVGLGPQLAVCVQAF